MVIRNDDNREALMTAIANVLVTTLYTVHLVREETVDTGAPCPECSDMDAFVTVNLYVREFGQCTRQTEACLNCAQRIALEERAAEVLIEIPRSLGLTRMALQAALGVGA